MQVDVLPILPGLISAGRISAHARTSRRYADNATQPDS